jgi:exonuclease SbcD
VRLVHLADLHLGYRQYQRLTAAGINQREADIAASFVRAIDRVIALEPDLVLIAGDVFHQVRPANPAIVHAFNHMARLVRALPRASVVMIAGNHDAPRSRDTVCILRLFTQLGVHVVEGAPQRLHLDELGVSVLCVPDVVRLEAALVPDATARYNVLLLHGEPAGYFPSSAWRERAGLQVAPEALSHPGWDYVALGHYHVHRQVADRAWYAGSLDYTSNSPWVEIAEQHTSGVRGKGFVEVEIARGTPVFHPLPPSRWFVDLDSIDGRGLGTAELNARIAAAVHACPGGIEDKVIRLVLHDVARHVARDLDHRALREYRRVALHFHLDVRPPELTRVAASGAPGKPATLADTLRARLEARPLDGDLDRKRFVGLGLRYLAEAEGVTPRVLEAP